MKAVTNALLLALLVVLSGCPEESTGPPALKPPGFFKTRTTNGEIAAGNLTSQIYGLEKIYKEGEGAPNQTIAVKLVGLLQQRASFTGVLSDYDRALEIAEETLAANSKLPTGWVLRAQVRASLHHFDEALSDLDKAVALGTNENEIITHRQEIWLSQGINVAEVIATRETAAEKTASFYTYTDLGTAYRAVGRYDDAETAYAKGLELYDSVSPFGVSLNLFARGVMWSEHAGQPDKAIPYYREAVRRLPRYAIANIHLAEIEAGRGDLKNAASRLTYCLDGKADHPTLYGQLSSLKRKQGKIEDANELLASAKTRFDEVLARHPAAFADHGAEFYLGPGADSARALDLAKINAANRKTDRSQRLLIDAALAAGDPPLACSTADEVMARKPAIQEVYRALADAFDACGRPDQAAAARKALNTSP